MAEEEVTKLAISWPVNPGAAMFANNIVVQSDVSGIVYLNFFQVNPPLLVAGDENTKKITDKLTEVEGITVARIALSKDKAKQFSEVLQHHLARQHEPTSDAH